MGVSLSWVPRDAPLAIGACSAWGASALRLGRRLSLLNDQELAQLRGVAGDECMALVGDETNMPWVDGISYFGRDDRAPSLWLPTHSQPSVHPALLARAFGKRFGAQSQIIIHSDRADIINVSNALSVSRTTLLSWVMYQEKRLQKEGIS